MMKFFRKHNKKLLAVFMALLLIVWLGGSALQSLLSPSLEDRVLATTDLGDIVELDRKIAEFETGLLENLGLNWKHPWPFGQVQHEPLSVYDWIVLTREAQAAGMMPRNVEIEAFLGNFGLTPERVHRLAFQRDVKSEQIYKAMAKYIAVFNAISMTVASFTPSESEVRIVARDELEKVKVKLVSLNAASFNDPQETFTEEQLREHFEKYRGEKAGKGVRFGYFQPAEIKVQYFKIDAAKVAAVRQVMTASSAASAHASKSGLSTALSSIRGSWTSLLWSIRFPVEKPISISPLPLRPWPRCGQGRARWKADARQGLRSPDGNRPGES